jgi:serine/threonine-protein kinase
MSMERWDAAVALFEQALQLPAAERRSFVDSATREDAALREQVLALLSADEANHPLFDLTPEQIAATVSAPSMPSLIGRTIGSYKLLRELGRGGMAVVYEGEDTKHRRSVAVKALYVGATSALGQERFRREIDYVAKLQHPNVLPLYDSGESEGVRYFVMPVVGNGTLRDRIAREGRLPIADVRRITMQIASGLDYAHRQDVIHRDVKPANILLGEEHASIADFGIAQHLATDDERLTHSGLFVGTPAYMSPEHVAGDAEVDARSDTYSLACVAFEMLTGSPPYQSGSIRSVLRKHLHDPVPSARARRPEVPRRVDEVFQRALAKEAADRYASTGEFSREFDAAFDTSGAAPVAQPAAVIKRRPLVLAAAAAVLVIGAAVILSQVLKPEGAAEAPSIAVLPFANMSDASNEYFSDGVTEELTGALAQLGRLRVTPRTTAFAFKGRTGDIRQIGDQLGVSHILEGSVRRDGDQVRFTATLYDANSGDRLWSNRYERDWGMILTLQTEIAQTIAQQLQLSLVSADRARLVERHTVNAQAYESYLKGRHFFDIRTSASMLQALTHFQRAVAIDSNYARAHAGLADTYSIMAWTGVGAPRDLFPLAERATQRALQLDSTIAETFVSLGIIHTFHTWDWPAAERATTRALALDSTMAVAWFFHAWHKVAQGRMDEALTALRRARDLDPTSLITNARIGTLLGWMGRLGEAETTLRQTLELDPQYPVARIQLARVLSLRGKHAEAIATLTPDSVRFGSYESGIAGFVHARAGRRDSALAALRRLQARPYVPAEGVAPIYAALGDREAALTWLERAFDARGVGLVFLAAEPMYELLRDEPRYRRIVQQLKLITPA